MKTLRNFTLNPRVAEFSSEFIPLSEIITFYTLDPVSKFQISDRPYTWSNTVFSVDGVISFLEPGTSAGKEIALGHIPNSGSGSDWRLLNGGWMFADAVVSSGTNLRTEPDLLYTPHFEDMQQYRTNILKKRKPFPVQVIVTRSGDLPFDHTLFRQHQKVEKLIITSFNGSKRVYENARHTLKLDKSVSNSEIEQKLLTQLNTRMKVFKSESKLRENVEDELDLTEAWKYLYQEEGIEFLDVSAGSVIISQLLQKKLLDEYRFTLSGSVLGQTNSTGKRRILNFVETLHFTPHTCPLLHYAGIRLYGEHHLFVRAVWEYRH